MAEALSDHVEEISNEPQMTVQDKSEKGDICKDVLLDAEYSHLNHPEPWRFEHWIPGGYSQSRMIRFKNPSTTYKAINFFAGTAICFYGYDQGVMSMVNLNHDYQKLMGIYPLKETQQPRGGIVAVYYGGTMIGALMAGALADRCGRVKAIVVGCLWVVLGAALQASAYNITWMCFGRVLAGIGVGAIDCVIPVWSAEVSSHSAREYWRPGDGLLDRILRIVESQPVHGLAYTSRPPISLHLLHRNWNQLLPESPRWLMKMGRYEEARDILQATRPGDIEPEARQIIQTVQYEMKVSSANQYLAMIFPKDEYTRKLRWRVFLAVWLQIMQQLVGIGVVTVYAVDLFSTAGFNENLSKLLAGFNNISYMFSVFFAVITLDRYGRRQTMLWGAVVMCIALLVAGILDMYAQEAGPNQRKYGAGVAAMTFFYTATFGATWLTTPWLYPTEIFPLTVRAKGGAWSVVGWSIGNGIVTMITPFLFQAIGYGTLLLLAGLNVFVIPFLILLYPETAGRSLEQMDVFFDNADSLNVFTASKRIREKGFDDWQWTKKVTTRDTPVD
ncbi:hypothetical protein N7497_005533 [Penicillium chrysogenum]|nr:hypothetical protein N7497_005533 [Penicillium chrysogenum]